MCKPLEKLLAGLVLLSALTLSLPAQAAEDLSAHWNGVWNAEGTLFTIGVEVTDKVMKVTKIETMGFEWSNSDGEVEGNIVRVTVEYAGVTGVVQAELIDPTTAIAFAASCTPDYMVVCALAKDRQAVFKKTATSP